ncbi:MAG: TetR/AcrR family transcriptional regulator [Oxalobacteraceae bacterium]|nr:MAG: TetR/AcrR family transcriptional regulator [Oxalobacteraceae bacterium]
MRADARRNYDHVLEVARTVVAEQGADASLRDIARRADVGLATLYRHFPTREALLETLLQESLTELIETAAELKSAVSPDDALAAWFRRGVAFVRRYNGVVDLMASAIANEDSALHASCVTLRSAGAGLLVRAQADGSARADLDGNELFALMGALGWVSDQPSFASRTEHLVDVVADAIFRPFPVI